VRASWQRITYRPSFGDTFSTVCDDNCRNLQTVGNLPPGTYIVKVEQSDGQHETYCFKEFTVEVTAEAARVIDFNADILVVGGDGSATVNGIGAPNVRILYRLEGTTEYFEACTNNCGTPHLLEGLAAGIYIIRVEQSDTDGSSLSVGDFAAIVTGDQTDDQTDDQTGNQIGDQTDDQTDFCADVSVLGGLGEITVSGANAPWHRIQYRLEGSDTYISFCEDFCSDPSVISGLVPGTYIIKVEESNGYPETYCSVEIAAIVTSARTEDSDRTGFCSDVSITAQPNRIVVSGVNAVWNRIQYSGPSTDNQLVTFCDDCLDSNNPNFIIDNLLPGEYRIITEESGQEGENYCSVEETVTVPQ